MNNNEDQIPEEITDWLGSFAFSELTASQKEAVLSAISEQEYADLHEAALIARKFSAFNNGMAERKQEALAHFDRVHHKESKVRFLTEQVAVWKAAAAFIVLLMAAVASSFLVRNNLPGKIVSSVDTVYVKVPYKTEPVIVYDTVVIEKVVREEARPARRENQVSVSPAFPSTEEEGLNVLSAAELGSKANALKGNSLKDDSLALNYQFAPL